MTLSLDSRVEATIRERAAALGVTVSAYIESLVNADQSTENKLEAFALEGLASGEPIEAGPEYWAEKHRQIDERLHSRRSE